MKSSNDILKDVKKILNTKWESRKGRKVPDTPSISLGNNAVTIDGTVLYADITDSTGLVDGHKDWFAAEIYKSYLGAACHIIRNQSGVITAFDGDRVMAVFIGDSKNSDAVKAALQISYIKSKINTEIKTTYSSTSYELQDAIGIDSSPLFVARTGIRDNNDLVWVGRAANYAAKLCSLVSPSYSIYITESVYSRLNDASKFGGNNPRKCMWDKTSWKDMGMTVYRSNWWWKF